VPALGFLYTCLVPRGRFLSATKEKAWMNFHQEMVKHRRQLAAVTLSMRYSVMLALRMFEKLIELNYPDQTSSLPAKRRDITDIDIDVISYVGGSIIQRQKQKLHRMVDSDTKLNCTDILNSMHCLQSDSECEASKPGLTNILDRGGLIHLTENSKTFFLSLEVKFREFSQESKDHQSLSGTCYEQFCTSDTEVTLNFEMAIQNNNEREKEKMFVNIVKHFFKVRIHHECKVYMERYRTSKLTSKKNAGLRKSLKKQVSSVAFNK